MAEKYPITLQKDEEVIALIRRHPIRVVLDIVVAMVVALLLLALFGWVASRVTFLSWLWTGLIIIVVLGIVTAVALDFYRYRNDLWLITNQRIVDSTQRSPFHHTLSTADLVNVQDINIIRQGILPTLFKFGDVSCQTASQSHLFIFKGVGNPEQVLGLVDAQRDLARQR